MTIEYQTMTLRTGYRVEDSGDIVDADGQPFGGYVPPEHLKIAERRKSAFARQISEEKPNPLPNYLESLGHQKKPLLRAIREKCLDCSHTPSEVKLCTVTSCPLWPYRLGSNPFHTRGAKGSEAD